MSDGNMLGGKNPHGLYVPMSEDEQEVVARLIESDDLEVNIVGWGIAKHTKFVVGDHRIGIVFQMDIDNEALVAPVPVYFLDLQLRTRTGLVLFAERLPTADNGVAPQVCHGMGLIFAWDIAIHSMDPQLVKMFKPGAIGLTSRRIDTATGERTERGNLILTPEQEILLHHLTEGEKAVKKEDLKAVVAATKAAGHEVETTRDGVKAPDLG